MRTLFQRELAATLAAIAILGSIVAWRARGSFNPDALCYSRIAHYYASGNLDLAVCQYWSPLFSWLLIPLTVLFPDPVHACRAAMVVSAVVFGWGCWVVATRLCTDLRARWLVYALAVVFGATAAGREIAPDLLMAGFFTAGVTLVIASEWITRRTGRMSAGVFLGLAFLTKAVALPAGLLLIFGVGALRGFVRGARRQILTAMAATLLGLGVLAGPWIALQWAHLEQMPIPVASTLNLAVAGPVDVDRFHPTFRTLHVPPAGRITTWEVPESMPYRTWSPFASPEYLAHALSWVRSNALVLVEQLAALDLLGLGMVCALLGFLMHWPWRDGLAHEAWRWSIFGVVLPTVLFLPYLATAERYFYVTYPFVVVAAIGVCRALVGPHAVRGPRALPLLLVAVLFLGTSVPRLLSCLVQPRPDVELADARAWAPALRAHGEGPVASIGPNGHAALYAAYLSERPFAGNVLDTGRVESLTAVGARVVFVAAGHRAAALLGQAALFVRLPPARDASAQVEVFVRQ